MYTFSASFAGDGDNYAAAADVTGYPARRITAAPAALDFGSGRAGAAVPSERTVTVVNEGGQTVTLTPPTAADYAVGPLSRTDLAPGETAVFTVQPKPGLAPGQHDEALTIHTTAGLSAAVELKWTVTPAGGGGGGGSSTTTATVKNPDGSATTTEKRADGTVVETTQWPDGSSREVTASEQKQADDSTVKAETVVSKDKDGNTTATASAAVTTDSGTGTVTLPAGVLDKVADVPGAELTVRLPGAELVFDHAAITAILAAGGKTPKLVIAPVAFEDLPQKARELLNEAMTYGFTVNGGGVDFGAGRVAVALDYTRRHEDTVIAVYYIDEAGDLTRMPGARLEDGKVRFETSHWSVYAVAEEPFPFTDVSAEGWCYDAVAYVSGRGLMTGTGGTRFSPEVTMTRAQLAAILWRLEDSPAPTGGSLLTDAPSGQWYTGAVAWCAEQGLVDGYGGGLFGPGDPVTREQLAVLLYRYAQFKGWDVSAGGNTNILSYDDAFGVSEWAFPALQWACGAGILTGGADGRLNPQGAATRAETAVILMRLFEV